MQTGQIFETTEADLTEPRAWDSLNDVFAEGPLEVWYLRPECHRAHGGICGAEPDPENLDKTHILLGSIGSSPGNTIPPHENDLDDFWVKLQGEFWSPNGAGNTLIRSKGLRHTSMSVGDCFRFAPCQIPGIPAHPPSQPKNPLTTQDYQGEVYRVESEGFKRLN